MRYLDRLDLEEAKREKDKARHAYSQTIAAQNDLSAGDGANASEEDADDDPDIVRPGEKPEDFVRLDSDNENDVNSVYDDDDDLGPTEPAAEDSGTASDLHFQPSLLGAVGGVTEIARGT
ncbi:uncharacterized protein IUM83_19469 [Phytophthora cinnamomi]|uniref:uncharacterized protein n=1 Tax=Phytophthora cinnamomi TaxID=4785 RepID=UPI00355A2F1B|nr:hypothetical protein IUM83_19469 [Phytophthora cinnamomi]